MANKFEREMMFHQRKKNMITAYLLGGFLGALGLHYFYAGNQECGLLTIALLVASFIFPVLMPFFYLWLLWGLIHTHICVEEYNNDLRLEIEKTFGEEK